MQDLVNPIYLCVYLVFQVFRFGEDKFVTGAEVFFLRITHLLHEVEELSVSHLSVSIYVDYSPMFGVHDETSLGGVSE